MAEDAPEDVPQDVTEEGSQEKKEEKKGLPIKLIIMIVVPLLLIGGVAAFLFMTSMGRGLIGLDHGKEKKEEVPAKKDVFYEVPDLLVNLNGPTRKSSFLKLSVWLTLNDEKDKEKLDAIRPKMIDQFQMFLRELEPQDIRGSAGLQRVKEELLKRVNTVAAPTKIRDVLVKEMLIQ